MFGMFKSKPQADEPLVIVPIPPLVTLFIQKEREKGSALTQQEVESIRDTAVCMNMRVSMAKKMEEKRGYPDISPENCWQEWSMRRARHQARK